MPRKRRKNWDESPVAAEYQTLSRKLLACHDTVTCPYLQEMTDELYAHLEYSFEEPVTLTDVACCYFISAKFMCSNALPLKTVCGVMRSDVKAISKRRVLSREAFILQALGWDLMGVYNSLRLKVTCCACGDIDATPRTRL